MLTLIEPIILESISDRPHLGCAMLIASCQAQGVKTTLIKGQTRFLKDMFINDSEELWGLIRDLKQDSLRKLGIVGYKRHLGITGKTGFKNELAELYRYLIIDKNPRHYYNGAKIEKFNNLYRIFTAVYLHYLEDLKYDKLMIVQRYISEIAKSSPRYLGFSLENNLDPISRAVRRHFKKSTGIPIIIGGSLTPHLNVNQLNKIFKKQHFDYLVIGPGEQTLPSLLKILSDKETGLNTIPNIYYQRRDRILASQINIIENLDKLPCPDFSQFDLDLYFTPDRILPLQTARGCSWKKCAFCSHHKIYLGKYRTFSVQRVIETINYLKTKYRCRHFVFHDEELPAQRAKKISKGILSNKLTDISIYTYARLTAGFNNDKTLDQLAKAGFSTIAWGMESGSQKVLNLMRKGTKISVMSQVLRKSSKHNITNLCFIFFGFPGETKADAQQTIEFLKKNSSYIEDLLTASFRLEPHSPLGQNPRQWKIELKKNGSYSVNTGMGVKEQLNFFAKFLTQSKSNAIKMTSGKLKYLPLGHTRRMLHFLNSSHGLLTNHCALEYFKKNQLDKIFPLILGELKQKKSQLNLCPVNTGETYLMNKHFPERMLPLDHLQKDLFDLANGRQSAQDILSAAYSHSRKSCKKGAIYKKAKLFLWEVFSNKWALAFRRPWAPAEDYADR